jgi:hypothetical protein
MKIKFNLERVISIILIASVGFWGVQQCSERKTFEDLYTESVVRMGNDYNDLYNTYNGTRNSYYALQDSAKLYQERSTSLQAQLHKKNAKINQIKAVYDTLLSKWDSISSIDRKSFLDSLFNPTGISIYSFDSTQLQRIGESIIDGKYCLEVKPQLEFQIQILESENGNCLSQLNNLQLQNNKVNTDYKLLEADNKKLKKKNLWKTVYGVGITALTVLVVL